ncbi:MAG: SDR family oxidoreductase [Bacteroidota bacterium]
MNLIIGGTGALGRALARRLLAKNQPVRVMTRTPEKPEARALAEAGAEIVAGSLIDSASLERACAGVTSVTMAAHSFLGRGREASAHVDRDGVLDLIRIAEAEGVQRFVYTSVYDYDPKMYHSVPLFRIKSEVEAVLHRSSLPYVIVRPTAFMELAHELMGADVLKKGKATVFGKGTRPRNFVAADDVAALIVHALEDASLAGQTIDIAGLENLSSLEVVELYGQAAGVKAKASHVPLGMMRLMRSVMKRLHPGVAQIMQASILGDTTDQRVDPGDFEERFPIQLTRFEDWIARQMKA